MGGVTIGIQRDAALMFQNPAALQSIDRWQFSLGGVFEDHSMRQEQHYAPVRYYSNFSLLMENRTHRIPNPNPLLGGSSAADTVQRPFDSLGPDWSRSTKRTAPVQAFLAIPIPLGDRTLVAGAGVVEYANLDVYYQNNNVISPAIFSQRPLPTFRPSVRSPIRATWSQYIQSREGSIRGYGVALSGTVVDNLSLGLGALVLNGQSDDREQERVRGRLTFFSNAFRLDSMYSRSTIQGTSEYEGLELVFGGQYRTRHLTVGFSAKPPMTITRTFSLQREIDTTGTPSRRTVSGEDRVEFPWRGTVGLLLTPRENVTFAVEYEMRAYAKAVYTSAAGVESSPWLSASVVRVGAAYRAAPWLSLRAGMRGHAEVFEAEGNPIAGEPVVSKVYSLGVGMEYAGVLLNVAYEHQTVQYEDIWGSSISLNRHRQSAVLVNVAYTLPSVW
jgi:opacity protein-like surface antigen